MKVSVTNSGGRAVHRLGITFLPQETQEVELGHRSHFLVLKAVSTFTVVRLEEPEVQQDKIPSDPNESAPAVVGSKVDEGVQDQEVAPSLEEPAQEAQEPEEQGQLELELDFAPEPIKKDKKK